jgi:ubiquinone/menaquinone biosynthesis C-methylase UbiE
MLFPSPLCSDATCVWNGRAFLVDGEEKSVLAYGISKSGWTDELTRFHEEIAGDNHYIDVASRCHTTIELRRTLNSDDATLIDIGCSSGAMLRTLRKCFPKASLIGADYISGPLLGLAASLPGIPFLQFDLTRCPLFSNSVDAIVLLNVLEHIEDDVAAMRQAFRILRPGGVVIIEVPAGPELFDVYDKQLMHFRRYTMAGLCTALARVGFQIECRSHLGAFLYPAFRVIKKRNQRYMDYPDDAQRQIVARNISTTQQHPLMTAIMQVEEALRPYVYYPAGIRCLLTCRKPK